MIGTIGTLILFTYYIIILYPFFWWNTWCLSFEYEFFILYLCVGLIILVYYWKISNKKLADQLLEQQVRMQQDYIKDLEKLSRLENSNMITKICFSLHSYFRRRLRRITVLLWSNDITYTPDDEPFPANLSMLDNMKVPEIRSLLSLKLMMAQEKGWSSSFIFLSQSNWIRNIR